VRPIKQASGASGFNEIFFTDVKIPDSQRVGEVGQGWQVALTTLMHERLAVGGGQGGGIDVPQLMQLARTLELEDGPAIKNAAVREKIADWYVRSAGLKYTTLRTMTALSRGQQPATGSLDRQDRRRLKTSGPLRICDGARRRGRRDDRPTMRRCTAPSRRAGSARRGFASPAARTRSCATSSPSAFASAGRHPRRQGCAVQQSARRDDRWRWKLSIITRSIAGTWSPRATSTAMPIGLTDGFRPKFGFAGYWLYCGDVAVVHLLDADGALPENRGAERGANSGSIDHVAFRGRDAGGTIARLKAHGLAFRENQVPDLGLHQVFVRDPNGIIVELNFRN